MREWLRTLRNAKGLSMKELGGKLGISESYYCAIENGDRQKSMDVMLASALAAIFEIPIAVIIEKELSWHERSA